MVHQNLKKALNSNFWKVVTSSLRIPRLHQRASMTLNFPWPPRRKCFDFWCVPPPFQDRLTPMTQIICKIQLLSTLFGDLKKVQKLLSSMVDGRIVLVKKSILIICDTKVSGVKSSLNIKINQLFCGFVSQARFYVKNLIHYIFILPTWQVLD